MNTAVGTDLTEAKRFLDQNDLVGIPTETVYGLAGNGLEPESIVRIFLAKNRPFFDPLILHFGSLEQVADQIKDIPEVLLNLAKFFWPGPLTLLVPKPAHIPDLITSGQPNVAIRVPSHPLALALLQMLDYPLAAPSANPFGYISPTTAAHVKSQLEGKLPYILDGGPCEVGLESTVVGLEKDELVIYRKGGLPIELISNRLYTNTRIRVLENSSSNPKSPGQLQSHYSPLKTMKLLESEKELPKQEYRDIKTGVLWFGSLSGIQEGVYAKVLNLSEKADLIEAAKNLFDYLRLLDNDPNVKQIIALSVPEVGLGLAINDRLRRASA